MHRRQPCAHTALGARHGHAAPQRSTRAKLPPKFPKAMRQRSSRRQCRRAAPQRSTRAKLHKKFEGNAAAQRRSAAAAHTTAIAKSQAQPRSDCPQLRCGSRAQNSRQNFQRQCRHAAQHKHSSATARHHTVPSISDLMRSRLPAW